MEYTQAGVDQMVVASYQTHANSEAEVRHLAAKTLFRSPTGSWFGGIFGMMPGAGLFVFPTIGALTVLGPMAEAIAAAARAGGSAVLVKGLIAGGINEELAHDCQKRLHAGEFLVVVHGRPGIVEQARRILGDAEIKTITNMRNLDQQYTLSQPNS